MKHLLPMAVLLAGASAWAAPSVTIDRVQQRYPWNGMVDIDYTVSDIANPDVYEIDLDVTDATGRLWDTVTLLAKPDTTVGSRRITRSSLRGRRRSSLISVRSRLQRTATTW